MTKKLPSQLSREVTAAGGLHIAIDWQTDEAQEIKVRIGQSL